MARLSKKAYIEQAKQKAHDAIDKVLDAFKDSSAIKLLARATVEALQLDKPSNKWSYLNRLLIMLAQTSDARGYKQWLEVGRQVKKGAKAVQIFGPVIVMVRDAAGNPVLENDGSKKFKLIGYKAINVFRYEDTEGDPLPELEPQKLPCLFNVAKKWGMSVQWQSKDFGFWGSYNPKADSITLCTHSELTFLHELSHAAHKRVLDKKGKELKGGQHVRQEALAEFCGAVLASLYGKDFTGNAYDYIKCYASDPHKAVVGILSEAQAVIDLILAADGEAQ